MSSHFGDVRRENFTGACMAERAGFSLVSEKSPDTFDPLLVGQTWAMDL